MQSGLKPLYVRRAEEAVYRLKHADATHTQIMKAGPEAITYALLALWETLQERNVAVIDPTADE